MQKIGFVGLGTMGSRIAARLANAGHPLVVCDIDPERVTALHTLGATPHRRLGGSPQRPT
jgi:3-hydroxyisobutyrate dehydrogenase-like beta-hydroxyacid dehydrogenase